ncbi:MAG: 50S ribosomal protein L25 [Acidimicrobiia bacterium]|nr:50S ribosomal protein L25 [bacterium]MXX01933.1 50S ribosomal protein L25 [Acidimicrobiia bacterium]MXY73686.1 50S ribosomal protein L25 [Acidimicrobiia bacterium]MYB78392.1 50S ribosomal protein L25 [Acidimicrobiia bacterium]MYD40908.1 50S ribosomal protein L25 [Acidimicrobiia bacterium]
MESHTLAAVLGRTTGSRESRRIIRSGRVPAVIYGGDEESVLLTLDSQEFERFMRNTRPGDREISLEFDDGTTIVVIPHQVDRHPYRDYVRHVDFMRVAAS